MRNANKRKNFLEQIRVQLLSGVIPAGYRFPPEPEFAAQNGISRNLVRAVYATLEDEGFLRRIKGKGTFAKNPHEDIKSVYFLVPCPDYLSLFYMHHPFYFFERLTAGAYQAAGDFGGRLVILPATQENDPDKPDYRVLESIEDESRVIVPGPWYRNIFPLLKRKRCRVVFLHNSTQIHDDIASWHKFKIDIFGAVRDVVKFFASQGCHKIALAEYDCFNPNNPVLFGYRTGLEEAGLPWNPEMVIDCNDHYSYNNNSEWFFPRDMFLRYEKLRPDAAFIGIDYIKGNVIPNLTYNQILHLPENCKTVFKLRLPKRLRMPNMPPTLYFNYKQIGYNATSMLLQHSFEPGLTICPGSIRQSSSLQEQNIYHGHYYERN